MTQPQYPFPNYPQHPYQVPPARPTSVTAVAVVGIILGAIALLCSPFALIPYYVKLPGPPNPVIDGVKNSPALMAWMVGSVAAGWVIGLVLLIGAIGSLSLKRWARTTMIGYAWAAVVLAISGLIFNMVWMFPMLQRQAANNPAGAGAAIGGVVGGIVGTVIGLALPICILYFFTRPHVIAAFEAERT